MENQEPIIVYGQIDQMNREPSGEYEGKNYYVDGFIEAQWLNEDFVDINLGNDQADDERFPVIFFTVKKEAITDQSTSSDADISGWYRFELSRVPSNFSVQLSGSEESASELFLHNAVKPSDDIVKKLDALTSTVVDIDADTETFNKIISDAIGDKKNLNVTVVDVGQGALAALHQPHEMPILFFDLGWPTMFQRNTAPRKKPDLRHNSAPVVLSHWDWDHWGMALDTASWDRRKNMWKLTWDEDALARPWIVPGVGANWGQVKISALHWRFALALRRRGVLNFWPDFLSEINIPGALSIFKLGSTVLNDRNQNGLVMVVEGSQNIEGKTNAILLPGDADYKWMPFFQAGASNPYLFTGLAATHHGGRFDSSVTPVASPYACLAISAGRKNQFEHPKVDSQAEYLKHGWEYQAVTKVRVHNWICFDSPRGNILLTTNESGREIDPRFSYPSIRAYCSGLTPRQ